MDKNLIKKIKEKREFSELPDSIVEKVARLAKEDVKVARALLRKYFGVFLTNRVLKGKIFNDEMLTAHMSSRKRDYEKFYEEIFSDVHDVGSIIDFGAGVNGFSYSYLKKRFGNVDYIAVEAVDQLVEHMNDYFKKEDFSANAVCVDLFDVESVFKILKKQKKSRVVFMFQVIDALENLARDFSKKFIFGISKECERIVLSLPTESLGGRKKFAVRRKWILDFLVKNFIIKKDFVMNGERGIIIEKKTNS